MASLVRGKNLNRHVLVEIDTTNRLFLDRKLVLFDRLDLHGGKLGIRQIDAVFARKDPFAASLDSAPPRAAAPASGFEP